MSTARRYATSASAKTASGSAAPAATTRRNRAIVSSRSTPHRSDRFSRRRTIRVDSVSSPVEFTLASIARSSLPPLTRSTWIGGAQPARITPARQQRATHHQRSSMLAQTFGAGRENDPEPPPGIRGIPRRTAFASKKPTGKRSDKMKPEQHRGRVRGRSEGAKGHGVIRPPANQTRQGRVVASARGDASVGNATHDCRISLRLDRTADDED